MINNKKKLAKHSRNLAFSMLELLIVIGIMAVMVSALIPAMGGINGRKLATSGNLVVDLARQARQNSLANGSMTALVLVNNSAESEWNGRLLTIMEFKPGSTSWSQLTKWEMLPKGVLVDSTQSTDFLAVPATTPALPSLTFSGKAISSGQYVYQVFLSDGRILPSGGNPPALRLVEGVMNGTNLRYTSALSGAVPRNYYHITLNAYTGLPKVDRP